MARQGVPSFVRDPDQAAELAALLRDLASDLDEELDELKRTGGRARQFTVAGQTIARYRRWADELAAESDDEPAEPVRPKLHIRPASNE